MIRGKKLPAILVVAAVFGCNQGGGSSSSKSAAPGAAPGSTQSPVTTGTVTPPPSSLPPSSMQPVSARPHTTPAPVTSSVTPTPPPPPAAPIPGFAFDIDAPTWSNGPVYIACDLPIAGNAWSANAFQLKADPVIPNRWTGLLQITSGTTAITSGTVVNFKITRGDWNNVEKGPEGEEVQNRVATCGPGPTKVYGHVYHWADDQILPPIAFDRDLGIWFPRALTGLQRQIYAHLPPGYDDPANANVRYPVVYALDGQTMYSASRSPSGVSLELDTAGDNNATITSGTGAFISIAIDSTFQNVYEMGPSFDPSYPGGGGLDEFAAWLLDELMPEIDRTYRTNGTNGVLGTGLQGLAAFRLGWDHPDRIQIVAAMSPLMTWNNEETVGIVARSLAPNLKIWLDVGTNEGKNPQAQLQSVRDVNSALQGIGFSMQSLSYDEVVGGTADEGAWQSRLPNVLSFLFP